MCIRDRGQGVLENTTEQLDLAIEGRGYFEVQLQNGERRYTRNGTFRQDFNGRIVTAEGHLLTDAVTIPPDSQGVSITNDGQVFSRGEENVLTNIGTIRLHTFANEGGLRAAGNNYYQPTAASGQPSATQPGVQGAGGVRQFTLERSNVETVDELVSLIVAQRNYEVNSRAIRVSDEMLQQINQLVR